MLIVDNPFMVTFEKNSINTYHLKPKGWKRCVDDTNVKWTHGKLELEKFLEQLKEIFRISNLPWNLKIIIPFFFWIFFSQ